MPIISDYIKYSNYGPILQFDATVTTGSRLDARPRRFWALQKVITTTQVDRKLAVLLEWGFPVCMRKGGIANVRSSIGRRRVTGVEFQRQKWTNGHCALDCRFIMVNMKVN